MSLKTKELVDYFNANYRYAGSVCFEEDNIKGEDVVSVCMLDGDSDDYVIVGSYFPEDDYITTPYGSMSGGILCYEDTHRDEIFETMYETGEEEETPIRYESDGIISTIIDILEEEERRINRFLADLRRINHK